MIPIPNKFKPPKNIIAKIVGAQPGTLISPEIEAYKILKPRDIEIIIPPLVNFKVKAFVASGTRDLGCTLTSKVKGAIEQLNLEAITDANNWAAE